MHNMKMKCHKYVLHMLVCAKLTSAHPLSALLLSRSLLEDASGLACGTSASEAVAGMGGVGSRPLERSRWLHQPILGGWAEWTEPST